jgi:hypothetical protein
MKKLLTILISVLLFLSLFLTGCGLAAESNSNKPSPGDSGQAYTHGIERPLSYAPVSASALKTGLGIYGSGMAYVGSRVIEVEIDARDLDSIREGYSVKLSNMQKHVILKGKVKSVPNAETLEGDACIIQVLLDEENGDETAADVETIPESDSQGGNGTQTVTRVEGGGQTLMEDVAVEAVIYLPAREDAFYLDAAMIKKGEDGKHYVWVSEKSPTEIGTEDWTLTEVTIGNSDGRLVEVLSGLKASDYVALSF